MSEAESRGLRFAGYTLLGVLAVFALFTLPPGAPLRAPETGALVGNTPFMNGLIVLIMVLFLAAGWGYGVGARTLRSTVDVVNTMEKAIRTLASLIFLLFVISQFLAFFTYSNMATLAAVSLGDGLEQAGLGPLTLLIGFVVIVALLDLIMAGAVPKWAIFAPVFVPLLMRLGVEPEAVLAAYRVADGPFNAISPLNAYFALIVAFAEIRPEGRRGHGHCVDVAVRGRDVLDMDRVARCMAPVGYSVGAVVERSGAGPLPAP